MAFAFRQGEPIDVGARRLARQGYEISLASMHGDGADAGVHEARRTLKRLRALIRLIAPMLGERAREANSVLRGAAHDLAGSRDAAVMVETFDAIAGDDPDARAIRRSLLRVKEKARPNVAAAEAKLRRFAESIDSWTFDGAWSSIEPGLRRSYRSGLRALSKARQGEVELHDVRKRAKDLQFQLTLMRSAFPQVLGGYVDALRELGARLGDEHDLFLLGQTLASRRVDAPLWQATIAERRHALRSEILPLAARIYSDRPRRWAERLGQWWMLSTPGD